MDNIEIYIIIALVAIIFFISVLKKVLQHLNENGFANTNTPPKKENFYEKNKLELLQNKNNDNIKKYDEFCEYLNSQIVEIKSSVNDEHKERFSDLIKELSMVWGQNSNEEKMQKNLFRFLRELEESVREILGEEKALALKDNLGKKYNELFS